MEQKNSEYEKSLQITQESLKKHQTTSNEMSKEYESLQQKHRNLLSKYNQEEIKQAKLASQVKLLEKEIDSLHSEISDMTNNHSSQLNQCNNNFLNQMKQLRVENEELVQTLNEVEQNYKQSISKLKNVCKRTHLGIRQFTT